MKEIIDIPDDIPQSLLDKADCVIVIPSVLKAAFIVGGSYGRGAMTCRSGDNFHGPWGAPTMMALEGGSFGFQIGGQATDFVLLVMNEGGARSILEQQSETRSRRIGCGRTQGPRRRSRHRRDHARRSSHLLAGARAFRRHFSRRIHVASR